MAPQPKRLKVEASGSDRGTLFQSGSDLKYALKIPTGGGTVLTATCLFCVYFVREKKRNAKRKATTKSWVFSPPFRPGNDTTHHKGQHPIVWAEYQALFYDEKRAYFPERIKSCNTFYHQLEDAGAKLAYEVSAPIVNDLIGKHFFHLNADNEGSDSDGDDDRPARPFRRSNLR